MRNIPPITRNLLIINCIVYMLQLVCEQRGFDLSQILGLHYLMADNFYLWQFVTYMFLHGSLTHLFFNMFSLWMFGRIIEQTMTARRFLIYYFVCGIGAAVCQELWQTGEYLYYGLDTIPSDGLINIGNGLLMTKGQFLDMPGWITIGASGACYGILLAFGMTFPEERIMLMIPPIPMKAKYFVIGYAAIELFSAFYTNGSIAHFAHLGGMLFGFLAIRRWRRMSRRNRFGGWHTYEAPRQNITLMQRIRRWVEGLFAARRPEVIKGGRYDKSEKSNTSYDNPQEPAVDTNPDHQYNARRTAYEQQLDAILDKIRRSGYDGLTKEEKEFLFRHSQK